MTEHGASSSSHIGKTRAVPVIEGGQALPKSYGETEASLLVRDPNWMFIYWDISPDRKENLRREYGKDVFEKSKSVVRVHDITGVSDFNGRNSLGHFDVPVILGTRSWYINVRESGKTYCCELGLVLADGRFVGIARTNTVVLPSGRVSDVADEKWMSVSDDFNKLLQLSGVEYIGNGSGEVAKSLAQRWELLKSVFSRAASRGVTSLSSASGERLPVPDKSADDTQSRRTDINISRRTKADGR